MKLLITLADIAALTAISRNIDPVLVTPYIREAHTFDVQLPAAVRAALETALPGIAPAFEPDEVAADDFATAATAAGWADTALAGFWYQSLRPPPAAVAWAARHAQRGGVHQQPARYPSGAGGAASRPASQGGLLPPLYLAGLRQFAPAQAVGACSTAARRPGRGGFRAAAL